MKKLLLSSLAAAALAVGSNAYAQLISGGDNAGNYTSGNLNGQNLGSGFNAWSVVDNNNGTDVFAGTYISTNVTQNGRQSIGSGSPAQVFGLYANTTTNVTAFVDLRRTFAGGASMIAGDSFSWQGSWSWNSGNRGFSLYSDGTSYSSEILNLNHSGGNALTYSIGTNSGTALADIYNVAFTVNMTFLGGTNNSLQLQLSGGTNTAFNQTFSLGGTPNSFKWYFSGAPDNSGNYEPNINNLTTTAVPEPSTYALLGLSAAGMAGYVIRRRRR